MTAILCSMRLKSEINVFMGRVFESKPGHFHMPTGPIPIHAGSALRQVRVLRFNPYRILELSREVCASVGLITRTFLLVAINPIACRFCNLQICSSGTHTEPAERELIFQTIAESSFALETHLFSKETCQNGTFFTNSTKSVNSKGCDYCIFMRGCCRSK